MDYDEIIARIPQVKQVLLDIKLRQNVEKHMIHLYSPKISQYQKDSMRDQKILKHKDHHKIVSNQIAQGFSIAEKWKNENKA